MWNHLVMPHVLCNMCMKIKDYFNKLFCPPRIPLALPLKPRLNHLALTLSCPAWSMHYVVRFIAIFTWDISPPRLSGSQRTKVIPGLRLHP